MSFLHYLKKETDTIHKSIERQSLAHKIVDLSITETEYKEHLLKQFYAYSSVEMALIQFFKDDKNKTLFNFCTFEKTDKLKKDFAVLGIKTPEQIEALNVKTLAEAIGAMYVIEGSMLGNLMLSKKIRACDNLSHIESFHFYNGNKEEALPKWKKFQHIVSRLNFTKKEEKAAALKAIETFKHF